MYQMLARRCYF